MNQNFTITRMSKNEVPIAIAWAKQEGWNPGLHDSECFYQTDPQGFFVGKLNDKIIAVSSAVIYDDHFAFCGFFIVDPAYRGKGFGFAINQALLSYIGDRNAGLDGVIPMLEKYTKVGYKLAYNNARYGGSSLHPTISNNQAIMPLSKTSFEDLARYDRCHFPAARTTFLKCWINQKEAKSIGYVHQGQLVGYGVIRPCYQGFKIGPLFADNPSIANELFIHLVNHAKGQSIYLDIPVCNPDAIDLITRYKMEKVFETARMYLKSPPKVALNEIYGITSFELG